VSRPRSTWFVRPRGDDGNALVEFTYLSVLLMVPLVYLLIMVFQVQRAAFGVTEAARQAGRAYVTADSDAQGRARAQEAADLAMRDQIPGFGSAEVTFPASDFRAGGTVSVNVRHDVVLPIIGGLFDQVRPRIPVDATHVEVVDRFRELR
jgi:Flp pilus assembly protein TadG